MPRTPAAEPPVESAHDAQSAPPATPPPADAWAQLNAVVEAYRGAPPETQEKVRARLAAIIPEPVTDREIRCTTFNAMSRTSCGQMLATEATRPWVLLCRRCHLPTHSPGHPSTIVEMEGA